MDSRAHQHDQQGDPYSLRGLARRRACGCGWLFSYLNQEADFGGPGSGRKRTVPFRSPKPVATSSPSLEPNAPARGEPQPGLIAPPRAHTSHSRQFYNGLALSLNRAHRLVGESGDFPRGTLCGEPLHDLQLHPRQSKDPLALRRSQGHGLPRPVDSRDIIASAPGCQPLLGDW